MRTITITCDKCGSRVEENRSVLEITTGPLRVERPEIDLCLGCARALMAWVDEDRDEIDGPEVDAAAAKV